MDVVWCVFGKFCEGLLLVIIIVVVFGSGLGWRSETEPPGSKRGIGGWQAVDAGAGGWRAAR